jgi:hypothetical protein
MIGIPSRRAWQIAGWKPFAVKRRVQQLRVFRGVLRRARDAGLVVAG